MAVDDFDDGYDASDYNADDLSSASQVGFDTYQNNQNQQFGMGSGDGMDSAVAGIVSPQFQRTGIDSVLMPNNMSNNMFTNYLNAGSNNVPNVFDLGGGVGDFGFGTAQSPYATIGSRFSPGGANNVPTFLNPKLAEMYKQQEMARTGVDLNKNPFAPNIFDSIAKVFGTSVDRTIDLGEKRVQEINDLRARQAFGLPSLTQKDEFGDPASYTSKDFEVGRDTNQGMVRELPVGGIERFARAVLPAASLLPRRAAPEQSQMYREAQAKANAPGIMSQTGDFLTDIGNLFTGLFSANPEIDTFDQFSNTRDRFMNDPRQIEDFSQDGATISDVDPIVNSVKVNREELDSMNRDGTGFASAAGSLFPRTTENSPNYTVPGEENLGMTIDRTGLDRYNLNSVDPNFKTQMNKLNSDERNFLTGRTDAIRGINEDELMADMRSSGIMNVSNETDPRNIFMNQRRDIPFSGRVLNPTEMNKTMPLRNEFDVGTMEGYNIFDELERLNREEAMYGRAIRENELEV